MSDDQSNGLGAPPHLVTVSVLRCDHPRCPDGGNVELRWPSPMEIDPASFAVDPECYGNHLDHAPDDLPRHDLTLVGRMTLGEATAQRDELGVIAADIEDAWEELAGAYAEARGDVAYKAEHEAAMVECRAQRDVAEPRRKGA